MACYNVARHLPVSIASLFDQTLADWELLAVDDGSADDTWRCFTVTRRPIRVSASWRWNAIPGRVRRATAPWTKRGASG